MEEKCVHEHGCWGTHSHRRRQLHATDGGGTMLPSWQWSHRVRCGTFQGVPRHRPCVTANAVAECNKGVLLSTIKIKTQSVIPLRVGEVWTKKTLILSSHQSFSPGYAVVEGINFLSLLDFLSECLVRVQRWLLFGQPKSQAGGEVYYLGRRFSRVGGHLSELGREARTRGKN